MRIILLALPSEILTFQGVGTSPSQRDFRARTRHILAGYVRIVTLCAHTIVADGVTKGLPLLVPAFMVHRYLTGHVSFAHRLLRSNCVGS